MKMKILAIISAIISTLPAFCLAGTLIDSYPDTDLEGGEKFCYSGRAESQFRCPSEDEVRGVEGG